MRTVEIAHVAKSFGRTEAVADVSFTVEAGEIFGLLGPNGAGKTTTIRLLLDLFKPDRGTIAVLGGAMSEEKKARIGYMPEERGLYQDAPLERCLVYLATLKGLAEAQARRQVVDYLERFDLAPYRTKKVKELSKGMQQKAQLIATIVHQPELIVIDEPFSALDPVNTQMVKDLMRQVRDRGATILMSTHQMHQVEELCDRILLINEGRDVLYGDLEQIRRRYAGNEVLVRAAGEIPRVAGVAAIAAHNDATRLTLEADALPHDVLRALLAQDVRVDHFEVLLPSLEDIFVRVVQEGRH